MRHLGWLLIAAAGAANFVAVRHVGLTSAEWLRKDAVYCVDERSLAEATAARRDANWLAAIATCRVAPEPYKVKVLGCGLTTCRVRVWDEYGFSGLGVTAAGSLSH